MEGKFEMKKKLCMAMAAMMIASSVSAFGAESTFAQIPHTFTAKVGTTEFKKDGEAKPLDVPVYIKDGYTMLPLRTFMNAALEKATMHWENGTADVLYGTHIFTFDVKNNKIMKNGTELSVSGKMEVRDGRVFVPLRNWGNILQALGYIVEDGDITWDNMTKLATIHAVEQKLDLSNGLEKPVINGEGQEAEFALKMTTDYDELENVGDGNFITQKHPEDVFGVDQGLKSPGTVYSLLDVETGEVKTYAAKNSFEDLGNGWLLMEARTGGNNVDAITDRNGVAKTTLRPRITEGMSDGMILVEENGKYGFYPLSETEGEYIEPQYEDAKGFSEGLAAVCLKDEAYWEAVDGVPEYIRNIEWGYIDKTGKLAIDAKYTNAEPFYEGLAKVRTEQGVGYINQKGNEVIPCQYRWGGYYKDGMTYVTDYENNTWLIDTKGEKLKLIAEGKYVLYAEDDVDEVNEHKNGILFMENIVDLPDGDHAHVRTYYNETGQISYEEYQLKKDLSEGLAPLYDKEAKKYGYVDENGVQIIPPSFDKAEPFEDGYAIVANEVILENGEEDVEWGIIKAPR